MTAVPQTKLVILTVGGRQIRAAIYARVSTANNGQDPRVQTRELGEFCERRGWTLVEYVDVGISEKRRHQAGDE
jgi:DNA invertase Pin-like site-specific DNA recombinase